MLWVRHVRVPSSLLSCSLVGVGFEGRQRSRAEVELVNFAGVVEFDAGDVLEEI